MFVILNKLRVNAFFYYACCCVHYNSECNFFEPADRERAIKKEIEKRLNEWEQDRQNKCFWFIRSFSPDQYSSRHSLPEEDSETWLLWLGRSTSWTWLAQSHLRDSWTDGLLCGWSCCRHQELVNLGEAVSPTLNIVYSPWCTGWNIQQYFLTSL